VAQPSLDPSNPAPNHGAAHVFQLLERLRLNWLLAHLAADICLASVCGPHRFRKGSAVRSIGHASALALAMTGAIMVIVSLGILAKPEYLVIIEIAVVLLAAQAFIINRLAGLRYPIWWSHSPRT
jgi:hypothetical protein